MYEQILSLLNTTNKLKISNKLKTDKDPLKIIEYINSIGKELKKKTTQDQINKLETKNSKKLIKGGVPTIHHNFYRTEDYTEMPLNEINMDIDFNRMEARPAFVGGCMATPLFNIIQKHLKNNFKGIKTSAITSVAGMATHRIMINIEKMNKSNRLKKLM
jgi:hypothetical protein